MFSPVASRSFGPVRCAWGAYGQEAPAEALLRPWLATQFDGEAPALVRDAHGRPRLSGVHADTDAGWSHSGDGLLVAVGRGIDLGVDLERLRPRPRALALAQRFFTAAETAALAAIDDAVAREHAFVRLWCAKEAVLKAHGRGLVFGLHRLEFAAQVGDWRLVACDPDLGAPSDWTLHAFAPWAGYVAAVAWRARR